ncbi:MAG TPA: methyltransferase domain-containing protein [Azospirillaceae bacterium]|nr:methyltransferase domain-containing protein [Azospirillaceae bacterium]
MTLPDPGGAQSPVGREAHGLLGGRVRLVQPVGGYRAAIDPVLLAAAVPAGPGMSVLDLGAGAGAASLCLAARIQGVQVTGLELQPELVACAVDGAAQSGLSDRVAFLAGDLARPPRTLARQSFDHVMANPPYLRTGEHTPAPNPSKAAANGEGDAGLRAWIDAAVRFLRPRGRLTMIHRADRFDEVVGCLSGRFGAVSLLPVWPRAGEPAKRVVVSARLGARGPARLLPGLVLHMEDGRFTPAAEAVLRDAAPLSS